MEEIQMKKYYIRAAVTAGISLFIYPFMNMIAQLERGYDAIGGEELLLFVGVCAAFGILYDGLVKTTAADAETYRLKTAKLASERCEVTAHQRSSRQSGKKESAVS
jgi:hypothetical protein